MQDLECYPAFGSSESINVYLSRKGRTLREEWIDSGSESGMTQNCHAEVAEPQPNSSMQNLNCHPEFISGSIRRGNEGSPLTPTLSRRARGKHAAFTLAEVLITLAIIGVVAAMTIPTLISDYQEKVLVTKVKKMYSLLSNAYQMYLINNAPEKFPLTEEGATKAFETLKPYLKISKDCGTISGRGCIYDNTYLTKKGSIGENISSQLIYYKFLLVDGSAMAIRGVNNTSLNNMIIYLDTNGPAGPNKFGVDTFQFEVNNVGVSVGSAEAYEATCAPADGGGFDCAWWVVNKGNLDYLKCDNLTASNDKCN